MAPLQPIWSRLRANSDAYTARAATAALQAFEYAVAAVWKKCRFSLLNRDQSVRQRA